MVRTGPFKVMLPLTFTVLGSTNHGLLLGVSLGQMGESRLETAPQGR
jgi:hypothetical protein